MATKPEAEPTIALDTITVQASVGIKVNLGDYESADYHLSETQKYTVTGFKPATAEAFADQKRAEMKERLANQAVGFAQRAKQDRDI